ncbi:MAG: bacteriohemerythrin [Sulfurovum sp.]|nr:bacteriohemerythrin [Sulfurovum sp.]
MLIQEREVQQGPNEVMNMLFDDEIEMINNFHDAVVAKDIEKIDELYKVVLFNLEDRFKTEEETLANNSSEGSQGYKQGHDILNTKLKKFHKRWEVLKGPKELKTFLEKDFKKLYLAHVSKWNSEIASSLGT